MNIEDLRASEGHTAILRFRDGHVVKARLLHVDTTDRSEVVYDVIEVIHPGPEGMSHIVPGATLSAALTELQGIEGHEA